MPSREPTIRVQVKLRATLAKFRPASAQGDPFPLELPTGSTVGDLTDELGIPAQFVKLVFIDHTQRPRDGMLADGELLEVFPPIAGG
jgi:sulfur carrier protein ThiS